jgi:small subunit ribosomal protein S6
LAYPIQKKSTGFYSLLQFDAAPTLVATLETNYRRDERILRFLTFSLDKYAYEYAEKRKRNKTKEETKEV